MLAGSISESDSLVDECHADVSVKVAYWLTRI